MTGHEIEQELHFLDLLHYVVPCCTMLHHVALDVQSDVTRPPSAAFWRVPAQEPRLMPQWEEGKERERSKGAIRSKGVGHEMSSEVMKHGSVLISHIRERERVFLSSCVCSTLRPETIR